MRYSRQERFFGEEKQDLLKKKKAVIIGLGGLGSVCAELLARAGIGKLVLIDDDHITIDNLHRQSLYDEKDLGKFKVFAAEEKIRKINSEVEVKAFNQKISEETINSLIKNQDLILDCTDNLETRFLINRFCWKKRLKWISTAVAGSKGFILPLLNNYCFECVFSQAKEFLSCDEEGILNTTVFFAASWQTDLALRFLLDEKIENKLVWFDLWKNKIELLQVKKNPDCPVCGKEDSQKKVNYIIKKCKTKATYSVKFNRKIDLKKIKRNYKIVLKTPILLVAEIDGEEVIVHAYGEILFKRCRDYAKVEKIAEEIYDLIK